jgi:hypothetical protein
MKIKTYKTNYTPEHKEHTYFWQCILIPTISILRMYDDECKNTNWHINYIVINTEWLFWSYSIEINL